MPKRDDSLLVLDILDAIAAILEYTNGLSFESFTLDRKTVDAVIRNLEIIGEASSAISTDFRELHPTIEWREMKDFRKKLIHNYFGVDLKTVWSVIQQEIPHNFKQLQTVIR